MEEHSQSISVDSDSTSDESNDRTFISPREICTHCNHPSGPTFIPIREDDTLLAKLRSGIALRALETTSTLSDISRLESDMAVVEDEISRLQESLEALGKHYNTLRHAKSQKESLLAPIRKLPGDILHRIFQELKFIEGGIKIEAPNEPFILRISEVSHYWRSLIYQSPLLWNEITVGRSLSDHADDFEEFYDSDLIFLEKCIRQSNHAPLKVKISGFYDEEAELKFIHALEHCVSRFEDIYIEHPSILEGILLDRPLTTLQRLNIKNITRSLVVPQSPKLFHVTAGFSHDDLGKLIFDFAPSLKSLHLDSIFRLPCSSYWLPDSQ